MNPTPAASIPLAAKRPTAPPRPSPSRTPYRPLPETSFSAALQAAADEALLAQYATPSPARIGAPVDPLNVGGLPGAFGLPGFPGADQPPPGLDLRLWEGFMRGTVFPIAPASAAAPRPEPAVRAIAPEQIRERQQAFLSSITGSDQTRVDEYDSVAQARAWGFSTCSAASLTAVLRAAGQDVRIADVMREMPGGMTIKLGLVSRPSLVNAANAFGARATDDVTSYDALRQATENGQPVLVDIRNGKFPEGHWIVVTGVDENGIRCADSSRYDLTSIPRGEFVRSWSSRGIRLEGLTPTAAPSPSAPSLSAPSPSAPTAAPPRANVRSA